MLERVGSGSGVQVAAVEELYPSRVEEMAAAVLGTSSSVAAAALSAKAAAADALMRMLCVRASTTGTATSAMPASMPDCTDAQAESCGPYRPLQTAIMSGDAPAKSKATPVVVRMETARHDSAEIAAIRMGGANSGGDIPLRAALSAGSHPTAAEKALMTF